MKRVLRWVAITVALVFPVGLSALLFGLWRFNRLVQRDVEALFAQATTTPEEVVVTAALLRLGAASDAA